MYPDKELGTCRCGVNPAGWEGRFDKAAGAGDLSNRPYYHPNPIRALRVAPWIAAVGAFSATR